MFGKINILNGTKKGNMNYWDNIEYQTINGAHLKEGMLIVEFADRSEVEVALQQLLPFVSENIIRQLSDNNLQVSPYAITIEVDSDAKDIPWDKIRVLTDKDFSRFLAQQAENQAKLIGVKLKRLREKKGIKSNELADRSGITAQTISRIEKGHQDIGFTTLRKLLASMGYSLKDLANEEVALESEQTNERSLTFLLKKLSKAGIDPAFITKRIIPRNLQMQIDNYKDEQPDLLLNEAASYLSSIYGWNVNEIWGKSTLRLDEAAVGNTLFKKGVKSNFNQIKAYMPYANFLAKTVLKARKSSPSISIPEDIDGFKRILITRYGGVALKPILEYAWDMGISVIPLRDSGIFHGAAWNINGKLVVVVKQQVTSHAKWIFDLLHEIYHALVHLKNPDELILETDEISPIASNEDPKEIEANSFASQVIFNGNPEPFAQEAVNIAKGKIEFLKNAVEQVADKHNLRKDALANYLAYRLAHQGNQWWGTAEGLQEKVPDPYQVAKEILLKNVAMEKLGSIDYNLLSTALNL